MRFPRDLCCPLDIQTHPNQIKIINQTHLIVQHQYLKWLFDKITTKRHIIGKRKVSIPVLDGDKRRSPKR